MRVASASAGGRGQQERQQGDESRAQHEPKHASNPTHEPARKLRSAQGRAGGDGPGSDRAAADQNQRGWVLTSLRNARPEGAPPERFPRRSGGKPLAVEPRARPRARRRPRCARSPFSASISRLARASASRRLAVADDPGERAGQLAGSRGSASSALRSAIATSPAAPLVRLQTIGRPARDRLADDHAERLEDRRQDERVGVPRRRRAGRPAPGSRRTAPPRRAARRARAARPRAGRCRRRAAPPRRRRARLRANASIRPPKFLSGTSRPTASTRTGPPSRGSAPATAAADRLGVERLEAHLDGVRRDAHGRAGARGPRCSRR